MLHEHLRIEIAIDYLPPATATVAEQNRVLEMCAATAPDGIALDPVEAIGNMPLIDTIRRMGISLILFDSPSSQLSIIRVGKRLYPAGGE